MILEPSCFAFHRLVRFFLLQQGEYLGIYNQHKINQLELQQGIKVQNLQTSSSICNV